jgi:hypothetical protein
MSGAGLTVGGFYAHFPSKMAMDIEIVRTMLGGYPAAWGEDLDGLEWVRQSMEGYLAPRIAMTKTVAHILSS